MSQEGTTEGDPLGMAMYAMVVMPLINLLKVIVQQVWFAYDAQASGRDTVLRVDKMVTELQNSGLIRVIILIITQLNYYLMVSLS